ncbi:Zn2Cys6 [Trichoderma simmonsii]|uniref:Zn2Cys6 n=1 Tax=Trichoderma simmonsii TaxID=1491479 RepID=A0A8G0PDV6_9HYPO|nr:Zn2Cys6 [Trichoderma simmonsii]
MVNTGKPSMACATCKLRRTRCDQQRPACSQCRKSGWVCPGFPSKADVIFRHHTPASQQAIIGRRGQPTGRVIDLSPAVTDRATAFFLHQYVFDTKTSSDTVPPAVHEHLPVLLQREAPTGALSIIISAVGLAALANSGTSTPWKHEAYRLYGKALQRLQTDLQDSAGMKSDSTLAAVMLMGTFEMIANGDPTSMESFRYHIVAGARCVEIRGPNQFRNAVSAILFIQLRRLIIMTCHQLQEPLPYALKTWSRWAQPTQTRDEASLNLFAELNEQLAAVRAEIKRKGIRNPAAVAAMLDPVDRQLAEWETRLPDSWRFKSYRNLDSKVDSFESHKLQYDKYPGLWVASTWNNYRMIRILIHESKMNAMVKHGSDKHRTDLQHSAKILTEMTNGICYSVAYILGDRPNGLYSKRVHQAERPDVLPKPGGYLLLWPLFLAGSLSTTSRDQRGWIACVLRDIGLRMGMQLAVSMAMKLEQTAISFSDREMWLIGEFFPV